MSSAKVGSQYDEQTGVYTNTWPAPRIPNESVYEHLLANRSFDDEHVIFTEHGKQNNKKQITYGQLKVQVHQLGAGLIKSGLRQGDVVMIIAPSSINWVIVVLAAQFAGLTVALASPMYAAKEMRHVYGLVQPKKVFLPLKLSIKAVEGRFKEGSVYAMDNSRGTATPWMNSLFVSEQEARQAKPRPPKTQNDTAVLAFSSGTTGLPKAVMMSHKNIVAMLTIITCFPDIHAEPLRLLTTMPFFHALALVLHVLLPIRKGGSVHIQVPFNPMLFIEIVEKEKIEGTTIVPPIVLAFTRMSQVNKTSFASMRTIGCGGAPLDKETQIKLREKVGADVAQGWGMTETTVGCLGIHSDPTPGTVGRVLPGVEAKLIDVETGKPVKKGERGELWVRGPNIFKGYFGNEKATRETMSDDGYLKTGDIAMANENGEFSIVDRIKELIKYKGNQIAPAELEGLLVSHPKVALAGVIGIYSDEQATELPRAYVQLQPNVDRSSGVAEELTEFVKKRASPVKWLRGGVVIVDQVPATPSGKLLRKELRAMAAKVAKGKKAESKL